MFKAFLTSSQQFFFIPLRKYQLTRQEKGPGFGQWRAAHGRSCKRGNYPRLSAVEDKRYSIYLSSKGHRSLILIKVIISIKL